MRRKPLIAALATLLLCGATLSLIGHLADGGEFSGSFGLSVLRYETTNQVTYTEIMSKDRWVDDVTPTFWFTASPPERAAQAGTNAGLIGARMELRNTGTQPISYHSGSRAPDFTCRVKRDGEWTCLRYRSFTQMTRLLGVGKSVVFWVPFPPDTVAWQIEFQLESVIPRKATVETIFGRGWWRLVPPPYLEGMCDGQSHINFKSEVFAIDALDSNPRRML